MGILFDLAALPVTGPLKGLVWVARKVAEQAEKELYDEGKLRGQLLELELRCELGEISQEEYAAAEEILLERLKIARERRAAENEEEV